MFCIYDVLRHLCEFLSTMHIFCGLLWKLSKTPCVKLIPLQQTKNQLFDDVFRSFCCTKLHLVKRASLTGLWWRSGRTESASDGHLISKKRFSLFLSSVRRTNKARSAANGQNGERQVRDSSQIPTERMETAEMNHSISRIPFGFLVGALYVRLSGLFGFKRIGNPGHSLAKCRFYSGNVMFYGFRYTFRWIFCPHGRINDIITMPEALHLLNGN